MPALSPQGTCTGETIELNGHEKRMLDLHNLTRFDYGLQPLCVHPALTEAARAHSQEMLDGDYFGHASLDGGTSGAGWRGSVILPTGTLTGQSGRT
jgi:uncharacterized protein YkwD